MTADIPKPKINFYKAFSPSIGSYHAFCACGREFVSANEPEADNDASDKAFHVDHSLSYINFEGATYVWDCTCWHERANRIQAFIDGHFSEIATYMNSEIETLKQEAISMTGIKV